MPGPEDVCWDGGQQTRQPDVSAAAMVTEARLLQQCSLSFFIFHTKVPWHWPQRHVTGSSLKPCFPSAVG